MLMGVNCCDFVASFFLTSVVVLSAALVVVLVPIAQYWLEVYRARRFKRQHGIED